jgi:coenzyme PQQ synthesis protein D (PqqD)
MAGCAPIPSADALGDPPASSARARVPPDVVYRSFPAETVLLNLTTGTYHGLNPTAGRMLDALEGAPTIALAAVAVAAEYGQLPSLVERDMCDLCAALSARGLIVIDAGVED